MKYFLSLILLLIAKSALRAQDTLFVKRHIFEENVKNVFQSKEEVYVRTNSEVYKLQEGAWEKEFITLTKPYVFFDNGFYETEFIPKSLVFDTKSINKLIPLRTTYDATAAQVDSRLFVATGGYLFEYSIQYHYKRDYPNMSIRDIFIEDSLKVISTYSGIFINDSIKLSIPTFSNGPVTRIGARYFLAWDKLSELFPPDTTQVIPQATSPFTGKARELIEFEGDIYLMNTKSIAKTDSSWIFSPIHQGEEYLDIENLGD